MLNPKLVNLTVQMISTALSQFPVDFRKSFSLQRAEIPDRIFGDGLHIFETLLFYAMMNTVRDRMSALFLAGVLKRMRDRLFPLPQGSRLSVAEWGFAFNTLFVFGFPPRLHINDLSRELVNFVRKPFKLQEVRRGEKLMKQFQLCDRWIPRFVRTYLEGRLLFETDEECMQAFFLICNFVHSLWNAPGQVGKTTSWADPMQAAFRKCELVGRLCFFIELEGESKVEPPPALKSPSSNFKATDDPVYRQIERQRTPSPERAETTVSGYKATDDPVYKVHEKERSANSSPKPTEEPLTIVKNPSNMEKEKPVVMEEPKAKPPVERLKIMVNPPKLDQLESLVKAREDALNNRGFAAVVEAKRPEAARECLETQVKDLTVQTPSDPPRSNIETARQPVTPINNHSAFVESARELVRSPPVVISPSIEPAVSPPKLRIDHQAPRIGSAMSARDRSQTPPTQRRNIESQPVSPRQAGRIHDVRKPTSQYIATDEPNYRYAHELKSPGSKVPSPSVVLPVSPKLEATFLEQHPIFQKARDSPQAVHPAMVKTVEDSNNYIEYFEKPSERESLVTHSGLSDRSGVFGSIPRFGPENPLGAGRDPNDYRGLFEAVQPSPVEKVRMNDRNDRTGSLCSIPLVVEAHNEGLKQQYPKQEKAHLQVHFTLDSMRVVERPVDTHSYFVEKKEGPEYSKWVYDTGLDGNARTNDSVVSSYTRPVLGLMNSDTPGRNIFSSSLLAFSDKYSQPPAYDITKSDAVPAGPISGSPMRPYPISSPKNKSPKLSPLAQECFAPAAKGTSPKQPALFDSTLRLSPPPAKSTAAPHRSSSVLPATLIDSDASSARSSSSIRSAGVLPRGPISPRTGLNRTKDLVLDSLTQSGMSPERSRQLASQIMGDAEERWDSPRNSLAESVNRLEGILSRAEATIKDGEKLKEIKSIVSEIRDLAN